MDANIETAVAQRIQFRLVRFERQTKAEICNFLLLFEPNQSELYSLSYSSFYVCVHILCSCSVYRECQTVVYIAAYLASVTRKLYETKRDTTIEHKLYAL